MKKVEMIKEILTKVNAKVVDENSLQVADKKFEVLKELVSDSEVFKVCKNKKDDTLYSIYDKAGKTRYIIIKVVKETKSQTKKSKVKTKETETGLGSKGKFRFYNVKIKNFDEEPKTITSFNTCEQIKKFLKETNKKNVEYLRIYCDGQEVRKSAWIERTSK